MRPTHFRTHYNNEQSQNEYNEKKNAPKKKSKCANYHFFASQLTMQNDAEKNWQNYSAFDVRRMCALK